jgi:hypothetical protein
LIVYLGACVLYSRYRCRSFVLSALSVSRVVGIIVATVVVVAAISVLVIRSIHGYSDTVLLRLTVLVLLVKPRTIARAVLVGCRYSSLEFNIKVKNDGVHRWKQEQGQDRTAACFVLKE